MTSKITVTLKVDDEVPATIAGKNMEQTLALLSKLTGAPLRGLTLTFECADEDTATEWRDELRVMLTGRPLGVEAKLMLKTDELVKARRMVKVTPMDRIAGFSEPYGVESVTLSSGERSVTLTPESARNAEWMLRQAASED